MSKNRQAADVRMARTATLLAATLLVCGALVSCSRPAIPPTKSEAANERAAAKSEATVEPSKAVANEPGGDSNAPAADAATVDDAERDAADAADADPPLASPERFVVLTPLGPLVVHLQIYVDGQPQGAMAESILDEAMQAASAAGERPTWDALAEEPRFATGLFGNVPLDDPAARRRAMEEYDFNRDQRAARDELAAFLAQGNARGRTFSMAPIRDARGGSDRPVFALLDDDQDGRLSSDEWTLAGARLRSRDADDDEVVTAADFRPPQTPGMAMERRAYDAPSRAYELQPFAVDSMYYAMWDLYVTGRALDAQSLALVPGLLMQLDTDADGDVDQQELKGILDARPDLLLKVDFRASGEGDRQPQLHLEALSADLEAAGARVEESPGRVAVVLPGFQLDLYAADVAARSDRASAATALFNRLDANNDDALDADEAAGLGAAASFALATLDKDQDGKLSLAEIKQQIERTPGYRDLQVSAWVGESADPLFGWLDAQSDGRLTVREMDGAAERLAELDANGDGLVSIDEVPGRVACAIVRGPQPMDYSVPAAPGGYGAPPTADAPAWMTAMDVNRDGEISHREFLGTAEQFDRLDANGNGFIDGREAAEASSTAENEAAAQSGAEPQATGAR